MHGAQVSTEHELGSTADEAAEVDHALGALAARGRAYELELARWLLRAEALAIHRRFGFASLAQYVDRRLGMSARELRDKLRVARALSTLPLMAEALQRGEQSWSGVRELTRVATPETEAEWLAATRGATVRHLERKVARHRPGDTPRAPRTQAHAPRRLVFEMLPEELATVRAALDAVWREVRGGPEAPSPGALLVAMAEVVLGRRDVNVPAYQTTVTICSGCARSWQRSGGELVEVSDAVAGCAACDGEVLGLAEVAPEDDTLAEQTGRVAGVTHVGRATGGGPRREGDADIDSTLVGRGVGLVATLSSAPGGDLGEGGRADGALVASEPGNGRAAAHVGRAVGVVEAERVSLSTHVGHEAAAIDHLRHLAAGGGARPILRVMTRALGIPLRSVTPQLRRLVFARDGGRCVVPGCGHWRFIDVHHVVPRKRRGPNQLDNLACLCTGHHRAVYEGVLALEGSATEGWVVRQVGRAG